MVCLASDTPADRESIYSEAGQGYRTERWGYIQSPATVTDQVKPQEGGLGALADLQIRRR